jgi:primosomal protein N' (replication factor Y)
MILQIAIPRPLHSHFDYLPPPGVDISQLRPGIRLKVPFGANAHTIGILLAVVDNTTVPPEKLKPAHTVLDKTPILPEDSLNLLRWASRYYHYPIGEVIATALPSLLNQGKSAQLKQETVSENLPNWKLTEFGQTIDISTLPKNAHRQITLLSLLKQHPQGLNQAIIADTWSNITPVLRSLQKKNWITGQPTASSIQNQSSVKQTLSLNAAQQQAVSQIIGHLAQFYPCLLDGVTGSGKTEVYLQIIQQVIDNDKQALILVPEINLTPQIIDRFKQRFAVPIAVFHSRLSPQERLQTWLLAQQGQAPIVIGTRSAIWTPLAQPGIFIVDEEHDASYKQQDHFRYSARDIAVVRAQQAKVPIILGSATPSLDSLHNAQQQRYQHLILPERAGIAVHPSFRIVDMRQHPHQSLSQPLKNAIAQRLEARQQVLLFINRRGYAPTLTCYHCGWVAFCQHCDAPMTFHQFNQELRCHHCGEISSPEQVCPQCHHPQLSLLGQGTERIEETLIDHFQHARILRIDSDTTRRKNAMNALLEQIHEGDADILVGTQMVAKGHHFPKVTLVGIINIDGGLYGIDFRATERMAQLLLQVAGRAGRADMPGEVIIQTYHPDHPLLTHIIRHGYATFAQIALKERLAAQFPPYTRLALLRAESTEKGMALAFLTMAKEKAQQLDEKNIEILGPAPAPMEKRADWYRAQLLLQAEQRQRLHQLLTQWLPILPSPNTKIRWSIDIDPQDLL